MSVLSDLLQLAVTQQASDIHLKLDRRPYFRRSGALIESDFEALSAEALQLIAGHLIPERQRQDFDEGHEVDFSFYEQGAGRFRVNAFLAQGIPTFAMRHVQDKIPDFETLHLPLQLRDLALATRGIIIVAGTTGSGKSTTLAASIQYINEQVSRRIISIEDPIEYLFHDEQSVITQREVGIDTQNFHAGLRYILRQDPDVIMIGEMRDRMGFTTALSAAETGHLIFTTLHAGNASQAIYRMLEFFPAGEHDRARMALAGNLHAIICQRLIQSVDESAVPAVEILINTPTVRKLLEKNKLDVISAAIETGGGDGMQSFNQSIYKLIKSGMITEAAGMHHATNPQALKMNLKGIRLDEDKRILAT